MHFVRTLAIPASSTTARTPPPAMTPVPSEAGLSSTEPAPNSPVTSYGMVPSVIGTSSMLFLASSMPFRMASGTSFALPRPKPTLPLPSPTTTSALKLNRRPPFTTLATRLMCTTFSLSSTPRSSVMMRRGPEDRSWAMAPFLELQSAFARAFRDGPDATVVEEAVAIEHDLLDALLEAAPRREQADLLRRADVRRLLELRPQLRGLRRHGEQGPVGRVGDHLHVDVPVAPEDAEAGPLVRAPEAAPDALLAAVAQDDLR